MSRATPHLLLPVAVMALTAVVSARADVVHIERSLYRNIVVEDAHGQRCMKFGRYAAARQTCISREHPRRLVLTYTRMMMAALFLDPHPRRILIVGLGGGTLPATLERLFPGADIDVAELDTAVIRVARQYFDFTPGPNTRVLPGDGRVTVKRRLADGARYDLIMLDAFDHQYIPEHMMTREFLQEVRGLLSDHGVLAANTFSTSRLYDSESATYADVFGSFFNLRQANRVILLRVGGLPSAEELERNAAQLEPRLAPLGVDTEQLTQLFSTRRDWQADAPVLTDQFSPANLLNGR